MKFNPATALKIVADSPETLRGCDLERLFDTFHRHHAALSAYVLSHRPELADWVEHALEVTAPQFYDPA